MSKTDDVWEREAQNIIRCLELKIQNENTDMESI